jgi:hypothetical protein
MGRTGWWVLGLVGCVHPAVVFAIGWVVITLVAHYAHLYAGDQGFRLGWESAILTGFGLSSLAMLTWWVTVGRN